MYSMTKTIRMKVKDIRTTNKSRNLQTIAQYCNFFPTFASFAAELLCYTISMFIGSHIEICSHSISMYMILYIVHCGLNLPVTARSKSVKTKIVV